MASLKHLSNDELRKKLKEYGIKSAVTSSTRNILLKKLNHVMLSEKNDHSNSKNSQPVVNVKKSYSRGQDETEILPENYNNLRVSPRSRSSINSRSISKFKNEGNRSRLGLGNLNSFSSDEDDTADEPVQVTHPRRSLRKSSHETSIQDTLDNNTPPSTFGKKVPIVRKRTGYSPLNSYTNIQFPSRLNNVSGDFQYDTGSDSDLYDEGDGSKAQNKLYYKENIFGNDVSQRKYNDSTSFSPQSKLSLVSKFKYNNDQNGLEYKNSFDSLIRDRGTTEITSPDDIVSQESHLQLSNGQSPFERVRKLTSEHCTLDKEFWLPSVPILLVVLLALFFCILGLCYLSINTPLGPTSLLPSFNIFQYKSKYIGLSQEDKDETDDKDTFEKKVNTVSDSQNKFPVCEDEIKPNCLSKMELKNVLEILGLLENNILPALLQQATLYQCKNSPNVHLSMEEMETLIQKQLPAKSSGEIVLGLKGLQKLSSLNPHWGLISVPEGDSSDLIGFRSSSQSTEIICHITSAIYNLLFGAVALIVGLVAAWMAFQMYRFHKKRVEALEQKSFELVEQILEVLENSCGTGGKEFIAVNHVRDCLIPPRERKEKTGIWNKAVHFIDDHDSRVYREIRSVGGEDQEVWRWVSGAPRSPISCPKSALQDAATPPPEKIWQGQAFESLETTQNVPQVSPTSCLKIRNMFDCEIEYGENWPCRIQDSLLEKCEGVGITHVAVDRVSKEGCVYVKCSSAKEAGKAYRALHGWWFDSNLVTVKYLREERYFERFPTARIATSPITPSNNQRLSLQLYPTLPTESLVAKGRATANSRSSFKS